MKMRELERRLAALERKNTVGIQTDWAGADGSPLVGGINTATATLIGGVVCSVEVPSDITSIVLVSVYANIGCSTVAAGTIQIGLVEDTEGDFSLGSKTMMCSVNGANMPNGMDVWTGTGHDTGANNFTPATGVTTAYSSQQGFFIDPYRKRGTASLPMPVNAGPRTFRLSRWREAGTGTCQVWSAYLSVIVLPGGPA
jgi:hypothetical protein